MLKLLAVYGHGDVGALEEIDRAFQANVRRPREKRGASQDGSPAPTSMSNGRAPLHASSEPLKGNAR